MYPGKCRWRIPFLKGAGIPAPARRKMCIRDREEADTGKKPPLELFAEFYERQNNGPMSEEQLAFAEGLIEKIWEDEG